MYFYIACASLVASNSAAIPSGVSSSEALQKSRLHPGLSSLIESSSAGPDIVASLIGNIAVSILNTTYGWDPLAWLTPSFRNSAVAQPPIPIYLTRGEGSSIGFQPADCVPDVFADRNNIDPNTNTPISWTDKVCFRALASYIEQRDLQQALASYRLALGNLQATVNPTVTKTGSLKWRVDNVMAKLLGTRDRNAFVDSNIPITQRAFLKTPYSLTNMELATGRFMAFITNSLNSLKDANTDAEKLIFLQSNPTSGNLKKVMDAKDGKLSELLTSVKEAADAVWRTHTRNMYRLKDLANAQLASMSTSIAEGSQGWSSFSGLAQEAYSALNETEALTISTMASNISRLGNLLKSFDSGLDTTIQGIIDPLLSTRRTYLNDQLTSISSDYKTKASQTRDVFRSSATAAFNDYNTNFKLAVDSHGFDSASLTLNGTVQNQNDLATDALKQLISFIFARQDALNATLVALRDTDKESASETAATISDYKSTLGTDDNALSQQSLDLMAKIEASQTDLLSSLTSDGSSQMNDLFQNVLDALTQIADAKKAAIDDADAKLAIMNAAVDAILASSGLSSDQFFQQISTVINTIQANKAATTASSSGSEDATKAKTASLGSGVLSLMSSKAFDIANNAVDVMITTAQSQADSLKASNDVINTAQSGAVEVSSTIHDATVTLSATQGTTSSNAVKSGMTANSNVNQVAAGIDAIEGKIDQLLRKTTAAGTDAYARFQVSSDSLADLADSIQEVILNMITAVSDQAKKGVDDTVKTQNTRVIGKGTDLTQRVSQMSQSLTSSQDSFVGAVNNLKVATVQDAVEKISAAVESASDGFESNSLKNKIAEINLKGPTDVANLKRDNAQSFVSDATTAVSQFVADKLNILDYNAAVTQAGEDQSALTDSLKSLSTETASLYGSSDGVLSASSDSARSGVSDILALSDKISDFIFTIAPNFVDLNKTMTDRQAAFNESAVNYFGAVKETFGAATTNFASDYSSVMDDATTKAGELKNLFDSASQGAMEKSETSSESTGTVDSIQGLISELSSYMETVSQTTADFQENSTELLIVNIFSPLVQLLNFAHGALDNAASADPDSLVSQVASLSSSVAQSTWDAVQAARDKAASDLSRAASEGKLNNQVTNQQLIKNSATLNTQVENAKQASEEFHDMVSTAGESTYDARTYAASDIIGADSEVLSSFSDAQSSLADMQATFATSLANSQLGTGDLSKGLESMMSGSVVNLMNSFVDMGDQLGVSLPSSASDAVDLEGQLVQRSAGNVARIINDKSKSVEDLYANAQSTTRSIQTFAQKIKDLSDKIDTSTGTFTRLKTSAVTAVTTAADKVIADEGNRISKEFTQIKDALSRLKSELTGKLTQLGR